MELYPAIKTENMSKTYRLYAKPSKRLLERLPWGTKPLHRPIHALSNISIEVPAGRDPLAGVTDNQVAPGVAVHVNVPVPELPRMRICEPEVPSGMLIVTLVTSREMVGTLFTTSVTGMVCGLFAAPAAVTVISVE